MILKNNYICAIDIGSSKIAACLAQVRKKQIVNIYFESVPAKGIKKGAIIDSIALVSAMDQLLKTLKEKSGIRVKFINANMSGPDIITKHSRAIIPLAERGNKVIMPSDVHKVQEQARILGSSLEEEIIQQIPSSYSIDSKSNILNPLGLYSHRLEVDLFLVCGKVSSLQSLSRAIGQSGCEIRSLFFSGIASSEAVMNKGLKKGVAVLCDIGSDLTELVVFEEGLLKDITILAIGGDDLTRALSNELKIPFELAEEIKVSHGSVGDFGTIKEDKEILVKHKTLYKPIKQRAVSQILTAKAGDLAEGIKEAVEKIIPVNHIDSFTAVGRTVLLEGFLEVLENEMEIPVKLGRINHPDMIPLLAKETTLSGQKYLTYLTALGIICQALRKEKPQVLSDIQPKMNFFARTINRVKEVYLEYF